MGISSFCRWLGGMLLAMAFVGICIRENAASVACGVASISAFVGSFAAIIAERVARSDSRADRE